MAEAVGQAGGTAFGGNTIRGNVNAALAEMAAAERHLRTAYATAIHLNGLGLLSASLRADYDRQRRALYSIQNEMYRAITNVLARIGQADAIPQPTEYPALPAARETGGGTQGVSGAGFGAVPLIIWAAACLAALAQIAIVVAVIWLGADLVARVVAMRENSARFARTVVDVRERFDACVRRTNNVSQCAALFPTPEAPMENADPAQLPFNTDPVMIGVGIAAVVVALGAVGYFWYEFASPGKLSAWRASTSSGAKGTRGLGSARAPKRLSSGDVSRRLRGEA